MRIPRSVVALGGVSLLMDASSELVHSLLPLLLVAGMGLSALAVGLIEGLAEATAMIVKVFSGVLSDAMGRRKPLVVLGYGLAALSKPLFPLAPSAALVLAARLVDRFGKGIRGAPRDALIADLTPPGIRGAAYGLRQALDSVGAILGPLAAIALMFALAGNIRATLWFAVIPALLAVALLVFGVSEPDAPPQKGSGGARFRASELRSLPIAFWGVVAIGAAVTLARFSEAFLILRANDVGLERAWTPATLVVMNIVYAATAYPAGRLADRFDKAQLLAAALAVLIAADVVLMIATSVRAVLAGVAIWGLHMGLSQGLLSHLVADVAPVHLRGSAFGLFNLVSGVALFAASGLAGALWAWVGPSATFAAGASFAALAMSGLLAHRAVRRR